MENAELSTLILFYYQWRDSLFDSNENWGPFLNDFTYSLAQIWNVPSDVDYYELQKAMFKDQTEKESVDMALNINEYWGK